MSAPEQYKVDHRCSTCMAWEPWSVGYHRGNCRRTPESHGDQLIETIEHDWCCEHIPDEEHQVDHKYAEFWHDHETSWW